MRLKTVGGSGLVASVLTLLHGSYLAIYLLWVLVLILVGARTPQLLNPIALAILDTVVYLFLGVGMLRNKQSYFVFAILYTVWGALLATFGATYKGSLLNLLSFLIVFFCTYYYMTVSKTNADVARVLGQIAGVLALIQGMIVAFALVLAYILHIAVWIILVPPLGQLISLSSDLMAASVATTLIYLVLGVGMLKGRKDFFFLAVFWTIVESGLAVANSSYIRTHFNIISILILAFSTYYYFAKTKT